MKKYFRISTIIYIVSMGMTLGATLLAEVVATPIIFNSNEYLNSQTLSNYQEVILMTQNFILLSYLINIMVIAIFLYEGYKYKMGERDKFTQAITILAIMSGTMFSFYYLPDIINMQLTGEEMTSSKAFINTHKGSEIDLKIFTFTILALMIMNMKKACK